MQKTIKVPIDTPEQITHLLKYYRERYEMLQKYKGESIVIMIKECQDIINKLEVELKKS